MPPSVETGAFHQYPLSSENISSEPSKKDIYLSLASLVKERLFLADPERAAVLMTNGGQGIGIEDFPSSDGENAWNVSLINHSFVLRRYRIGEELFSEHILLSPDAMDYQNNHDTPDDELGITHERISEVRSLIQTIAPLAA